jgi:hypothetical protein
MEVITGIITLQMIFSKYWEAFKKWHKGKIREAVIINVEKILKCRTGQLGFHAYKCPKCREVKLIPHSCKSRFCSSCGKIATDRWVIFKFKDYAEGGKSSVKKMGLFTFIKYLIRHIPDKYFRLERGLLNKFNLDYFVIV